MKKPKNTPIEEEEVRLEDLTPEQMKQVVAHFASLISSKTSETSSEAEKLDSKKEN